MYKLCVFAGTTEGREVVAFLEEQEAQVYACVATDYGQALLPRGERVTVSAARLDREEMAALFRAQKFDLVIDATHPYADLVTRNIADACEETGTPYHRLLRADCDAGGAVYVPDVEGAVEYLKTTQGPILLTTGSKELHCFAALPDFAQRAYARVLPMEQSLLLCREAGLQPSHILAMQGPFSQEMNAAMLRATGAKYLVTKASGAAGGFEEKLAAAAQAGVAAVIIGRPPQRAGMGLEDTLAMLCSRFGFQNTPQVRVAGIGPGAPEAQTGQVRRAIMEADCVIGAKRMLEAVAGPGQAVHAAIAPEDIRDFILSHREYRRFAVVMSGDVGFFSGAKKLLPLLPGCRVELLPGLSSLVYLCARLGESYEDVLPVTLHGRENPILLPLSRGRRVFVLVGGDNGLGGLCRTLTQAGLGATRVSAGENLSYPNEKITRGTAEELQNTHFDSLCAALLHYPAPPAPVTFGLPDEAFLRAESVPMTKSEVRAVCLSKLALPEDAVVWDVGAGTGSVTVEMALAACRGRVYAIERKEEAVALLRENCRKFRTDNVTVVPGIAPDCCAGLPAPTHAFLGGTGGGMKRIIALLLEKNPNVRIVATAVTLESIAELTACMKELSPRQSEAVSLTVSRSRPLGPYHLMTAQNPICIFTFAPPPHS